jgi:hypothetical protein
MALASRSAGTHTFISLAHHILFLRPSWPWRVHSLPGHFFEMTPWSA